MEIEILHAKRKDMARFVFPAGVQPRRCVKPVRSTSINPAGAVTGNHILLAGSCKKEYPDENKMSEHIMDSKIEDKGEYLDLEKNKVYGPPHCFLPFEPQRENWLGMDQF